MSKPTDVDPRLLDDLYRLGDEYGPLGVALAAARLTDPKVVGRRLLGIDRGDSRKWPLDRPEEH